MNSEKMRQPHTKSRSFCFFVFWSSFMVNVHHQEFIWITVYLLFCFEFGVCCCWRGVRSVDTSVCVSLRAAGHHGAQTIYSRIHVRVININGNKWKEKTSETTATSDKCRCGWCNDEIIGTTSSDRRFPYCTICSLIFGCDVQEFTLQREPRLANKETLAGFQMVRSFQGPAKINYKCTGSRVLEITHTTTPAW